MGFYKGKNVLVTGGTGSFGNAVVKKFLQSKIYSETARSKYQCGR